LQGTDLKRLLHQIHIRSDTILYGTMKQISNGAWLGAPLLFVDEIWTISLSFLPHHPDQRCPDNELLFIGTCFLVVIPAGHQCQPGLCLMLYGSGIIWFYARQYCRSRREALPSSHPARDKGYPIRGGIDIWVVGRKDVSHRILWAMKRESVHNHRIVKCSLQVDCRPTSLLLLPASSHSLGYSILYCCCTSPVLVLYLSCTGSLSFSRF